jgi:hypothetical protein
MTDALARWCLAECERGGDPWAELEAIIASTPWESAFVAWIEQLRDARQLSNDDVTLVAIQL